MIFLKKSAKILSKTIDPFWDFDSLILHPETGEMVQIETSVRPAELI